jgi:hypothetical protein
LIAVRPVVTDQEKLHTLRLLCGCVAGAARGGDRQAWLAARLAAKGAVVAMIGRPATEDELEEIVGYVERYLTGKAQA